MLRRLLTPIFVVVEAVFARLARLLPRRTGDAPLIQPYIGYATRERLRLRGRVLEEEGIQPADVSDSWWRNFITMLRRFETDEMADAALEIRFDQQKVWIRTDAEGYFDVDLPLKTSLSSEQNRYPVEIRLLDDPRKPGISDPNISVTGEVIVAAQAAEFGVISDLDDTVLVSDAFSNVRVLLNTFFKNARTRLPFPGVGAFYRALQAGTAATFNPIFYVSSSPWNLYDFIMEFFKVHTIPIGPIFLQDIGIGPSKLITQPHSAHKRRYIDQLLTDFPDLRFILIGDSGQHDPQIYAQVVADYPDRIAAIYIRDVRPGERANELSQLIQQAAAHQVDMLLVEDTLAAAEHAANSGFVTAESLAHLRETLTV